MPGIVLAGATALLVIAAAYAAASDLNIGHFSTAEESKIFLQWQPYTFDGIKRHTRYQLRREEGIGTIRADSDASASGLIRSVTIDLEQHPVLTWRWKVIQRPDATNDLVRAGDDHAARLYLIFNAPDPGEGIISKFWHQLTANEAQRTHAINYIWAHSSELNKQIPNPYTASAVMLVVNSGDDQLGEWVTHQRNVLEDYRSIFGRSPPPISAVAIMTDTDNTESSAIAYYGDIEFSSEEKDSGNVR